MEGAVRRVVDEEADADADADAEAVAEVKDEARLGRRSSGVIVVRRVSQVSSSGLTLRGRSPRPPMESLTNGVEYGSGCWYMLRCLFRRSGGSPSKSLGLGLSPLLGRRPEGLTEEDSVESLNLCAGANLGVSEKPPAGSPGPRRRDRSVDTPDVYGGEGMYSGGGDLLSSSSVGVEMCPQGSGRAYSLNSGRV